MPIIAFKAIKTVSNDDVGKISGHQTVSNNNVAKQNASDCGKNQKLRDLKNNESENIISVLINDQPNVSCSERYTNVTRYIQKQAAHLVYFNLNNL